MAIISRPRGVKMDGRLQDNGTHEQHLQDAVTFDNSLIDSLTWFDGSARTKSQEGRVARHQRLRATEVTALFDPPTEQRDLVRHFTL